MPAKMTGDQIDQKQLMCEPLTIGEFLAYLYGQNYTKSTTARKLATLRSFFKFLIRRGMSASTRSPPSAPPSRKSAAHVPGPGTGPEALEAPGDADILAARDKAMLKVLYSSGIRVSESSN